MNASELIDKQIKDVGGWRGKLMQHLRELVHEADPEIIEEWKWGTGVYTHHGLVCAISAFKDHVKLNFFNGAALQDVHKIINSGLESKVHRAIDFEEKSTPQDEAIKDLVKEAVAYNLHK